MAVTSRWKHTSSMPKIADQSHVTNYRLICVQHMLTVWHCPQLCSIQSVSPACWAHSSKPAKQTDRRTTYGWIDLGWQVVFDQTIWSSWEFHYYHKGKGSPYSITERRVPELIPVLSSQPAGDVSHKPRSKLPLLSARPAITSTTPKTAATSFAALWTDTTVCLRLLPDSITAAIWTRALLRLSPAC